MLLSCIPVKIKGLVVLMIFCFQAPPEALPAEDSMFQFAFLLWFSVFFFVAELCLRKLVMFCALLGPAADTLFGVDVLVLLPLFFFQLRKDCFCFPQLLLFALLHLASVLSETRSVVWIHVALG